MSPLSAGAAAALSPPTASLGSTGQAAEQRTHPQEAVSGYITVGGGVDKSFRKCLSLSLSLYQAAQQAVGDAEGEG
jgi:hypothetical protein